MSIRAGGEAGAKIAASRGQLVIAALALFLAMTACGRPQGAAPGPSAKPSGERFTVQATTTPDYKPVAAKVTTRNMGEARARIGGILTRLAVKEGDLVRQGQLIGTVSDQRLALLIQSYEAQVAAAAAEVARTQTNLQRAQALYARDVYPRATLDQAEAEAKAAQAALAGAQALRAASAELSAQGAVLAPTAGRVLAAKMPEGSVVNAGDSIATITAGEPLLRVVIPEASARALRVDDKVTVDPSDLSGAGQGAIVQIYPAVAAGQVTADIAVTGLRTDLVGQSVRVRIKVGDRSALIVPRRFISTRFGIDYARLLDSAGHGFDIVVQLAPGPALDQVEVLSGLRSGDVLLAPGPTS